MAKGIFKTSQCDRARPNDPESLFRDLKERDPEIRHLWSHQADLLRTYNAKNLTSADVALELPTGAGKTLIGLLIAEFRRRKNDERVVYLCPTRQLVHQVAAHAAKYGIMAHAFVGRQRDYPAGPFTEYQTGAAIAITTYSGVFNVNPRIDDPNVIICDDAHAGESFITSMWSVDLDRSDQAVAYNAVVDLVHADLPTGLAARLRDDDLFPNDRWFVELVPSQVVRRVSGALRDALDTHLRATEEQYAWQTIRDHLHACNLYVSWTEILIRPFIAPTKTHRPFAEAAQRIYMSATLGEGGELERITGVNGIARLPIPTGWDKQGSGRRLFLLPELSLHHSDACQVALYAAQSTDRALVLVPTQSRALECENVLRREGLTVLRAPDIEGSLDAFLDQTRAALVLANRYDGLDFPGDACRLLVLEGLPGGTNLQESFLLTRLQAAALLRDRMITRFTQAVGRCTRSDTDYALVFVKGTKLIDFILKAEHRSLLHPETQAELAFGIKNSQERTSEDFEGLVTEFLGQTLEWKGAVSDITKDREKMVRATDPISTALSAAVADEVRYAYALWAGRYEDALQYAQAVADALNNNAVQGYRAWWYYSLGDCALALHEQTKDDAHLTTAQDRFRRAAQCAPAVPWFSRIARRGRDAAEQPEPDEQLSIAVEGIVQFLQTAGLTGPRFEKVAQACLDDLSQESHVRFHSGLKTLGDMLGFRATQPKGKGVPDGVWVLDDSILIGHEAKTEQGVDGAIGVDDARQASGHGNWIRANVVEGENAAVTCTIITPRMKIDAAAVPHIEGVFHLLPKEVHKLAEDAVAMLRPARTEAPGAEDEQIAQIVAKKCREHHLTPGEVVQRMTGRPASELEHQQRL